MVSPKNASPLRRSHNCFALKNDLEWKIQSIRTVPNCSSPKATKTGKNLSTTTVPLLIDIWDLRLNRLTECYACGMQSLDVHEINTASSSVLDIYWDNTHCAQILSPSRPQNHNYCYPHPATTQVGWFLFWWNLEFQFLHGFKLFHFVHWFQNWFCFALQPFLPVIVILGQWLLLLHCKYNGVRALKFDLAITFDWGLLLT